MAWLLILSIFLASDTVEVKGTSGLSYRLFVNQDKLCFQYKLSRSWSEPMILDSGDVSTPSISITPKDLIHVVWQKIEGEESRIYYITTDPITPDMIRHNIWPVWSEKVRISTELPLWQTEPGSNPFTETYGEYVYAAWRGPNEEGQFPGDIWRRARRLDEPPWRWREPQNKSVTPDNESNYPVMSPNFTTVWQEQINDTNWDIRARFESEDTSQSIFETPKSSTYPHINGYWDPDVVVFHCNTIWTEQLTPTLYEVKFGRYDYSPSAQPPTMM